MTCGADNPLRRGFETRAIHAGYDPADNHGGITPPVHFSSTFTFPDIESGMEVFAGARQGHAYSRISNPYLEILERRIADLDNADAALCTASGMGAITSVCWSFLESGDEIIADNTLYGCTFSFLNHGLAKYGVKVTHVDLTEPAQLKNAINEKTRLVFCEAIANPNMRVLDISALAKITKSWKACRFVVDNTYLTAALFRPLDHGADIVVHSATKYMGGHGDLVGGVVCGSGQDIEQVRMLGVKDMTGAVMAPMTAMLLMRGLKTLSLRVERHSQTALCVARKLLDHPAVAIVHYPGLESSPYYTIAHSQAPAHGGVVAFELHGGLKAAVKFMNGLKMISRAVSLGDAESLIQHPATMTHSTYSAEERERHGISDELVRLSVGLETAEDIWTDLYASLDQVVSLESSSANDGVVERLEGAR